MASAVAERTAVFAPAEFGTYTDEAEARAALGLPDGAVALSNCWARSRARYCQWCFAAIVEADEGKCRACGAVMGLTLSWREALAADAKLGGERRMREWGGAV